MPVKKFSNVAKIATAAQTRRNSTRGSVTRQNGNNSMNSEGNSRGRKRKTKVKKANKSKRGSQKKRGRRASKRQRGGGGLQAPRRLLNWEDSFGLLFQSEYKFAMDNGLTYLLNQIKTGVHNMGATPYDQTSKESAKIYAKKLAENWVSKNPERIGVLSDEENKVKVYNALCHFLPALFMDPPLSKQCPYLYSKFEVVYGKLHNENDVHGIIYDKTKNFSVDYIKDYLTTRIKKIDDKGSYTSEKSGLSCEKWYNI